MQITGIRELVVGSVSALSMMSLALFKAIQFPPAAPLVVERALNELHKPTLFCPCFPLCLVFLN